MQRRTTFILGTLTLVVVVGVRVIMTVHLHAHERKEYRHHDLRNGPVAHED